MVYQGPSKACARCKQRHIKCDETRPECRNCQKRQLPCPGYAPEPGIRFQDETTSTINQAIQREKRQARRVSSQDTVLPPRALPQDTEVVALNFFFDNYATLGRGSQSSFGFFENIVPIFSSAAPSSAMSAATSAVALTLMSEWHGRLNETPLARRHLGNALSLLRSAIKDDVLSLMDDTMMAVLLLKFHDVLGACKKTQQVPEDHINGAIALIQHRGLSSLESEMSKRMLLYVRHTAISCAIQRRTSLDAELDVWRMTGLDMTSVQNPSTDLDGIAFHVANFRASSDVGCILLYRPTIGSPPTTGTTNTGTPPQSGTLTPVTLPLDKTTTTKVRALQTQAADLDYQLSEWSLRLTGRWRPTRVSELNNRTIHPSIARASLYGRYYDNYPSAQVANVWNLYRGYRMLVVEILLRCEALLHPTSNQASSPYAATFQELVDDLLASIPFLLGNRTEPGSIDEFDLPTTAGSSSSSTSANGNRIRFPAHPDDDAENVENLEMDMFMTAEQRTKSLIAQGPWKLHESLGQVLHFVSNRRAAADDPILRPGQAEWIQAQLNRVMRVQRIPATATSIRSSSQSRSPERPGESSSSRETLMSSLQEDEGATVPDEAIEDNTIRNAIKTKSRVRARAAAVAAMANQRHQRRQQQQQQQQQQQEQRYQPQQYPQQSYDMTTITTSSSSQPSIYSSIITPASATAAATATHPTTTTPLTRENYTRAATQSKTRRSNRRKH